jgi:integrase
MAKKKRKPAGPWWWNARNSYYIMIKGKHIKLGEDKHLAEIKYHQLMAERHKPDSSDDTLVSVICDKFLAWCKDHRSEATHEWYETRITEFLKKHSALKVSELQPHHVNEWALKKKSPTTQRNAVQSIKSAMKFGKKEGWITTNPIADMERPAGQSREEHILPDEFETLLTFVRDKNFKLLLEAAYDSGSRPQEITRVEKRHFDEINRCWVFPRKESKGNKRVRRIFLPDIALQITKALIQQHPEGPLFRNSDGNAWTKDSVGCHFYRIQERMARAAMVEKGLKVKGRLTREQVKRHAKRYCLYLTRHGYAFSALKSGMDSIYVSKLLGHTDSTTLFKVYSHLESDPAGLLEKARSIKSRTITSDM